MLCKWLSASVCLFWSGAPGCLWSQQGPLGTAWGWILKASNGYCTKWCFLKGFLTDWDVTGTSMVNTPNFRSPPDSTALHWNKKHWKKMWQCLEPTPIHFESAFVEHPMFAFFRLPPANTGKADTCSAMRPKCLATIRSVRFRWWL